MSKTTLWVLLILAVIATVIAVGAAQGASQQAQCLRQPATNPSGGYNLCVGG